MDILSGGGCRTPRVEKETDRQTETEEEGMAAALQSELVGPCEGGRPAAGEQLEEEWDEDLGHRAARSREDQARQGHWAPRGHPGHRDGSWAAICQLG